MFNTSHRSSTRDMVDRAALRSESALHSGVDNAHHAIDELGASARRWRAEASDLGQRGIETLRDRSRLVRDRAQVAGERTVGYIQHEPVKSVLVAAAAGAALVALLSLLGSRSQR